MNMKKYNTIIEYIIILLLELIPITAISQGYKVKEMKILLSDISASTQVRYDSVGVPCGLVKIIVKDSKINFGGNVVGGVDNKMNEYWVYLSKGSRFLFIRPNDALPFKVDFNKFGIDEIESKVTYQLRLDYKPFDNKNSVIVNVTPHHAELIIDNCAIDKKENGSYRLYLPKGEHICRISAKGYATATEIIMAGKEVSTNNIQLESLMAKVKIGCQTSDVRLYVNDKEIGVGSWEGQLPADLVRLEARKDGFTPSVLEVKLTEKGNHEFMIPALKQLKGSLRIVSNVSDFDKILLDGTEVMLHEGVLSDVVSGKHTLSLSKYGYGSIIIPIVVKGNVVDSIQHTFIPLKGFEKAVQGDGESQFFIASKLQYESKDYIQAAYWYSLAIDNLVDDGNSNLKTTALNSLAHLYGNKSYSRVYNIQKSKEIYLKYIEYKLSNKGHTNNSEICNAYQSIGDMYKKEKLYSDAIPWYIKCEKYHDNVWGSYLFYIDLGDCYIKIGNKARAIECYKRVLKSRYEDERKKAHSLIELSINDS